MIGEDRLRRYTEDLVAGRRDACAAAVQALLDEGHDAREIYERVFRDSLYEIGRRWQAGAISVAAEHIATAITEDLLLLVLPHTTAQKPSGHTAIVSAAAGEYHQVGARIVADTLEIHGWEVHFVGAGAPSDELLGAVVERRPDLLALSVSLAAHLPKAISTIERVRAAAPTLPIVVGGQALANLVPEDLRNMPDVQCLSSLGALEDLVARWPS